MTDEQEFTYMLEAYKTAVSYFSDYADRVSARFNILLVVDIALASFVGNAWLDPQSNRNYLLLSLLGFITSLLLYIQSAQDKYVLKRHLKRINNIRGIIEKSIGREDIPALFTPLDDTDLGKRSFVFESITSWRSNFISLTRVPAITSLVLLFFWVTIIFTSLY